MEITIDNISGLTDSNNLLRAFWAELRNRFGKCTWRYQPYKDGNSHIIFLGWADINQEQEVPISLTYSQKTIVSRIHFGQQYGEPIDEASELGQQLKDAFSKAYQRRNSPNTIILKAPVSSLYRSLAPYSGQWFEISPEQHPISLLSIKIRAFDEIDAEAEFRRISSYILDVLSIETNSLFWFLGQEDKQDNISEVESKKLACPLTNTFVSDEEWMDDTPLFNEYLLISSQAVQFIDRILSKDELSADEETFIRSCHHFHVARGQDALIYDQLVFSGEHKNENGSTKLFLQKHPRFKSESLLSRRANEIATVLYMSAIEVVSTIDANSSERCNACGQEQYKISARVVNYVNKYLALEDGHHLSKVFKSHYGKRSKYLHAGIVLSDPSYAEATIPRLDPSSDSGVSQRTSVLMINLREWIGYMLRQQLKSI
ncbi:MAG: hypothetical protein RBJ76_10900 [Stenomitos frigidus ULC029]